MKKLIALITLSALALLGQSKHADAVKAAEKAWADATVHNDRAGLDKVLSDDLAYIHSTGDIDTKKVFIANLDGVRKYTKIEHENIEVREYGNTAVVMATANIATSAKGAAPAPAHLRFLHVWILRGGKWQMVAHQSLRLPH